MEKKSYKLQKKKINGEIAKIKFSFENLINLEVSGILLALSGGLIITGALSEFENAKFLYGAGALIGVASPVLAAANPFLKKEKKEKIKEKLLRLQMEKLELLKQYNPDSKLIPMKEKKIDFQENRFDKKKKSERYRLQRIQINNQIASIRFTPERGDYYIFSLLGFFGGLAIATSADLWINDKATIAVCRVVGSAISIIVPSIFAFKSKLDDKEKREIKALKAQKKDLLKKQKEDLFNRKSVYDNVYDIQSGKRLRRK